MQNISHYIKHPNSIVIAAFTRTCEWLPDKLYLQILFFLHFGRFINLKNPKTFSEKLQWLKLYNRRPEYTQMVDKYAVKQYVADKIGTEHIIPTIDVWNRPEDIDFDKLPNSFVLKTTHSGGSSGVVICKDKSKLNIKKAIKKLKKSLKTDLSKSKKEWPYRNVPRKIIAEKYMEDEYGELRDYKFYCFNGEVKFIKVDYHRFSEHRRKIYDTQWNLLPLIYVCPNNNDDLIMPKNFEQMLDIAKTLSKNIPHLRVDLYNINGKIYFGELTFFPTSGYRYLIPNEWNYKFGDWLKLPSQIISAK